LTVEAYGPAPLERLGWPSMIDKRTFLKLAGAALAMPALSTRFAFAAEKPAEIALDYAYYNPVSLLLKEKGWLEEEFAADGVPVRWVLSLGSNKALEYLRGASVSFGSTAGSAALVARAGGLPVKAVYVYSKPEWTALVTTKDSAIAKVEDLKGKSVAVTRGTDPHIFLLRSLDAVGLSEKDINPVLLQHPDGYAALASGQVDAWAGLDPHMAKAEVEIGAKLFHRNADFNTYGVLNVAESFAADHPDAVRRVLAVYERARAHALAHPDELKAALVKEAKIAEPVAAIQLGQRTDLSNPVLGDAHRQTFQATGEVLRKIGVIKDDVDIAGLVGGYVDPSYLGGQAG
jgi:sulfonate transport system substrate-binding protein